MKEKAILDQFWSIIITAINYVTAFNLKMTQFKTEENRSMAKCILVSQDSSREEGIISIIHSLQKFRHSTDEIFSTVEKRFDEYRLKIGALQKRMESLEMKLNNIKVAMSFLSN